MNKGFFIAVSTLVVSSSAFAQNTTSLKYSSTNRSDALTAKITVGGVSNNVYIGALNFQQQGSTNLLTTFCIDPSSMLNKDFHTYNVSNLNFSDPAGLGLAGKIMTSNWNTNMNANQQAALQLAIWSAVTDNGSSFNANGSKFKVSGVSDSVLQLASTYYSTGFKASTGTGPVTLYTTTAKGGQSQMQAVPEPATMAALGLGALGLLRRRKAKKA
jgi:hypothetical protein